MWEALRRHCQWALPGATESAHGGTLQSPSPIPESIEGKLREKVGGPAAAPEHRPKSGCAGQGSPCARCDGGAQVAPEGASSKKVTRDVKAAAATVSINVRFPALTD